MVQTHAPSYRKTGILMNAINTNNSKKNSWLEFFAISLVA
jgi:hypothetical protein